MPAITAPASSPTLHQVTVPISTIKAGVNATYLLAVSVHLASPTVPAVYFDASFVLNIDPTQSPSSTRSLTSTATASKSYTPTPLPAGPETIPLTSAWHFADTGADLSQQPWTAVSFNDSAWTVGRGPLGTSAWGMAVATGARVVQMTDRHAHLGAW